MKQKVNILLLLLFTILSLQQANAKKDSFKLLKNRRAVVIPFQFINKNIIIPLTINGSDSLYFMLDSGLTNTLITELFQEDSLQLNSVDKEVIRGLGGDKTLTVIISYDNEICMKGIKGTNQRINLIKEDIFNLSQLAGRKINGIIGYDFLRHFIVKIDYQRKLLTLYNPKKYRKKLRSYLHFPMEIIGGKPYIKTNIIAPDKQKKKLKLMLDTGASLSLWLMDNNKTKIPKPKKTIATYLGQGLSGRIHGEYGRIPALLFKEKKLENVLTAYPNPEEVKAALTGGRNGSIGSEVLRRFYVIMDYPNKELYLKPNKAFKDSFDFDISGVAFYQPSFNIPVYQVFALRENSPAAKAGLKKQDVILAINGKSTLTMSLHKLIETFQKLEKKTNKPIELLIQRDTVKLKLQYKIPNQKII